MSDYTISYINIIDNDEIDIDELEGIIQQLDAISRGWADDFKVITKHDDENIYQWEKL